jgi:DNA (cytosine-5)-methyltransferase 1
VRNKPRALDLFCGAGGASMGLYRAGFDVTGVDWVNQPRYPFKFRMANALHYPLDGFDFIWASPPCQFASECGHSKEKHPNHIPAIRERLRGRIYAIENVDGARDHLWHPFMLCGTMFGLPTWRHRWFEIQNFSIPALRTPCNHTGYPVLVCGSGHGRGEAKVPQMIEVLGVPWMKVRREVRQAIPPCYSEFIGKQAMRVLEFKATADAR